jgi:hypothetical protein
VIHGGVDHELLLAIAGELRLHPIIADHLMMICCCCCCWRIMSARREESMPHALLAAVIIRSGLRPACAARHILVMICGTRLLIRTERPYNASNYD